MDLIFRSSLEASMPQIQPRSLLTPYLIIAFLRGDITLFHHECFARCGWPLLSGAMSCKGLPSRQSVAALEWAVKGPPLKMSRACVDQILLRDLIYGFNLRITP